MNYSSFVFRIWKILRELNFAVWVQICKNGKPQKLVPAKISSLKVSVKLALRVLRYFPSILTIWPASTLIFLQKLKCISKVCEYFTFPTFSLHLFMIYQKVIYRWKDNFEETNSIDKMFLKNGKMKKKNEEEKNKEFSTGWKIMNWQFLEYLNLADFKSAFRFFVFFRSKVTALWSRDKTAKNHQIWPEWTYSGGEL